MQPALISPFMNPKFVIAVLLLFTALPLRATTAEDLYGTWTLKRFTTRDVATGKEINRFGSAPKGFLGYSRDGRMYAIIVQEERPKIADMSKITDKQRVDLFTTMIAYAGTFTFDGKVATHNVDISWNGNTTGTAQIRHVELVGKTLTITTSGQPSGVDGRPVVSVLVWQKIDSPSVQ